MTAVAPVPRRSIGDPTASATTERRPSAPTIQRAVCRTARPRWSRPATPTDPTGAVADDVGDARAVVERGARGASGVDQDRIEHRAARRVEGVDAVRRLDRDPHLLVGEPERGAYAPRGCRRRRCRRAGPSGGAARHRRASGRGSTRCRSRNGCGRRRGRRDRRGRGASRWPRRRRGRRRRRRREREWLGHDASS